MTGTSMDAIDVVIARFDEFPEVILEYSTPLNSDLRTILMDLATKEEMNIDLFVRTHFVLAQEYAKAVAEAIAKAKLHNEDIRAIGLHGQTIRHLPKPAKITASLPATGATFQLGSGAALAALTGIDVISDFRSADVALGGEGAPLVPMFDYHFLKNDTHNRICLNIGGIANLTFIPAACSKDDVMAFDTGPGNMVMDALMSEFYGEAYDKSGLVARKGKINKELLSQLLENHYLKQPPPKSTGREQFGESFLAIFKEKVSDGSLSSEDAVSTATELTARSIAQAFNFLPAEKLKEFPSELIVSGGGAKNIFLCERLKSLMPEVAFRISDELGIPSQAKEALAFAWFAKSFLDDEIIHLPKTTGASGRIILGSLSKGK